MPAKRYSTGDSAVHVYGLQGEVPALDLTSDPWNLKDGEASIVMGVDTRAAGRLRPAPIRRHVPVTGFSASDAPVINIYGSDFKSSTGTRVAGVFLAQDIATATGSYDDEGGVYGNYQITATNMFVNAVVGDIAQVYNPAIGYGTIQVWGTGSIVTIDVSLGGDTAISGAVSIGLKGSPYIWGRDTAGTKSTKQLIKTDGAWDASVVNGYIIKNGDGRKGTTEIRRISSLTSTKPGVNDTINWNLDLAATWASGDKFYVIYSNEVDKRGIWLCNGRKFWLIRAGAVTEYLDLGSDDYLGEEWFAARIANNLVVFVNDKYPARVIRLDAAANQTEQDGSHIAGLIAPVKPITIETDGDDDSNLNKSWTMSAAGSGGSLSAGVYRAMVRATNVDDNAYSRFVPVYDINDLDDRDITAAASDRLSVRIENNHATATAPPYHKRWTHLEIWRTQVGGTAYFLERLLEIPRRQFNETSLFLDPALYAVTISDTAAAALTQALDADFDSGYPPPMCKAIASLAGVTLCFGRSAATRNNPTFYGYWHAATNVSYDNPTKTATFGGGELTNYTFQSGDALVVEYPPAAVGAYAIASKGSGTVVLTDAIGATYGAVLRAYIRRGYEIEWPYIESDEDVWYSRTDQFAPESFATRTLQLSSSGDTFRSAINVGNYVAVIMAGGIHLLYLVGADLRKDTVSVAGDGTPWKKSVVVYRDLVLWATPDGAMVMRVSPEPDDSGHRGNITNAPGGQLVRQWFRDAYDNGYDVDAGHDVINSTIRFRRAVSANVFESLDFNYLNGKWSQIDADNGLAYVRSTYADSSENASGPLYSVTSTANVFQLFYDGSTDNYVGSTVQALLSAVTSYTTTRITYTGQFSTSMVGDVVRFKSTNSAVHRVVRVITAATANYIEWSGAVSGLVDADSFVVGANLFRIKFAPMIGSDEMTVKTVDGVTCIARTGANNDGSMWPATPTGTMMLRLYRDYLDAADDEEATGIGIFDDDTVAKLTEDRMGTVETQGRAIEFEVELVDARSDFRLELLQVRIREEGDIVEDDSTAA